MLLVVLLLPGAWEGDMYETPLILWPAVDCRAELLCREVEDDWACCCWPVGESEELLESRSALWFGDRRSFLFKKFILVRNGARP